MIKVDLGIDTERLLRHNASVLGQPLECYLRRILQIGTDTSFLLAAPPVAMEEVLDLLAADLPPHMPLPPDFSRRHLYIDHD